MHTQASLLYPQASLPVRARTTPRPAWPMHALVAATLLLGLGGAIVFEPFRDAQPSATILLVP